MKKTTTIIISIALSFALLFTFDNLNSSMGQNNQSGTSGGNSTSSQNQNGSSANQSQSGSSNQSSLSDQIEKQLQINQANQTGRSEHI